MILLGLALSIPVACLDRLLEGPLVLTSGLGVATSLAPDGEGAMLVATSRGVLKVSGTGEVATLSAEPAIAVTSHPGRVYTLAGGKVRWEGGTVDAPDAVDILAGWDGALCVLSPTALDLVDPATGARATRWRSPTPARAVALGPPGALLVLTVDTLWQVDGGGAHQLVGGIAEPRAVATDGRGVVWLAAGDALYRVDPGGPVLVARFLGDVRDAHPGTGGLFAPEDLYFVTGDGTLAAVRPP